jgi:hypothetical protein
MERIERRLRSDRWGYCLRFRFSAQSSLYDLEAARTCLAALRVLRFSGRCEYYEASVPDLDTFRVGLGLKQAEGTETPDRTWWNAFVTAVAGACAGRGTLHLDIEKCVPLRIDAIRSQLREAGNAVFQRGESIRLLDLDHQRGFACFAQEILQRTSPVDPLPGGPGADATPG